MTAIGNPCLALAMCMEALSPPRNDEERTAYTAARQALDGQPYPAASLETGACAWECVLDWMNDSGEHASHEERAAAIVAVREEIGTSALRLNVLSWVDAIDQAWQRADVVDGRGGNYPNAFDWEFVPDWIARNIDWSGPNAPTVRPPSPLNELAPDLRAWLVDREGFRAEIMGGGAFGLQQDGPDGSYILLTCLDGGGMPTGDSWHVGAYLPGQGDAAVNLTSEHEGRAGVTLEMALGAARGVLADFSAPTAAVDVKEREDDDTGSAATVIADALDLLDIVKYVEADGGAGKVILEDGRRFRFTVQE